jgi:endonuclease III
VVNYVTSFNLVSTKSAACLLLYRMRRVEFAVDTNVLRVMTRLGWLKPVGLHGPQTELPSSTRTQNSS